MLAVFGWLVIETADMKLRCDYKFSNLEVWAKVWGWEFRSWVRGDRGTLAYLCREADLSLFYHDCCDHTLNSNLAMLAQVRVRICTDVGSFILRVCLGLLSVMDLYVRLCAR